MNGLNSQKSRGHTMEIERCRARLTSGENTEKRGSDDHKFSLWCACDQKRLQYFFVRSTVHAIDICW